MSTVTRECRGTAQLALEISCDQTIYMKLVLLSIPIVNFLCCREPGEIKNCLIVAYVSEKKLSSYFDYVGLPVNLQPLEFPRIQGSRMLY